MPTVPSSKRCTSGPRRRKPRASGGTSAGSGGHPRTTWRRCWRRSACTGSCSGPASRCGCRRRAWQSWTCSILRRSSARRSNPRTRHVGLRADPVRRLEWGLLPAVPVPFRGRALAEDAQRAYARWMARQPVAGVAVWAHTGRGPHLSADERRCVLATWRAALSGKVLITGEDRFLGYSVLLGARAALIGMGAALTDLQAELLAAYARRDFATFLSLTSLCDAFGATAFAAPVEGYVQRMLWALAAEGVVPDDACDDPWRPALGAAERDAVQQAVREAREARR